MKWSAARNSLRSQAYWVNEAKKKKLSFGDKREEQRNWKILGKSANKTKYAGCECCDARLYLTC